MWKLLQKHLSPCHLYISPINVSNLVRDISNYSYEQDLVNSNICSFTGIIQAGSQLPCVQPDKANNICWTFGIHPFFQLLTLSDARRD